MSVLPAPSPVFQGVGFGGLPLPGGKLFTYVAGTNTPQATYTDSTQLNQNTNPTILNANGQANVWLVIGQTYKLVLQDFFGNQIWSVDNIPGGITLNLTQQTLGQILYPQTPAELAAFITPVNYFYPPGNVLRYGTNSAPGFTDMSVAINNAMLSNTNVYVPSGTYFCSAALNLITEQKVSGDGGSSVLLFTNPNINLFLGSGLTGCIIRDLKLQVTGTGSILSTGAIRLFNCTYCTIENVEFTGMNWAGVWLQASANCIVRGCYFHGFTSTNQDGADITVYNQSGDPLAASYNIIESNECFGGCDHGIFVQAASGSLTPSNNVIRGNRVGQHTAYGIACYNNAIPLDGFNTIEGNYIENIQGNPGHGPGLASGAGIYCPSMGGMTIVGNTIRNCCVQTTLDTLAPAGIGLIANAGQAPFTISGNTIIDMPRFYGIKISAGSLGGVISGNSLRFTTTSVSQPAYGIYLINSPSNTAITGNSVYINNTNAGTVGIYCNTSLPLMTNLTISGNTILGTSMEGIRIDQSGGNSTANACVVGNTISGGGPSSVGILLIAVVGGTVSSNTVNANTSACLILSSATQVMVSGNYLTSSGSAAFITTATCTGSMASENNYLSSSAGLQLNAVNNGGTGVNVRQLGTIAPTAGTQVAGDTVYSTTGVTPFALWCSAGGTPGTFISLTIP